VASIEEDAAAFQQQKIAADAAAYQQQQSQPQYGGSTSQLYSSPNTVSESQFKPSTVVQKQVPDFMKDVDMIGSGAAEAASRYSAALMNAASNIVPKNNPIVSPFGQQPDSKLPLTQLYDTIKAKNEADVKNYAGAGVLHGIGSVPTELAITAPVAGPAFNAVTKAGEVAGLLAPKGLQTAAKYGTNAVAGATAGAGLMGAEPNPDNPNQTFDMNKATQMMGQPSSYIIPAIAARLGGSVSNWANNAEALEAAKQVIPGVVNRNFTGNALSNSMFDGVGNATGLSKIVGSVQDVGPDLANYINKLSGNLVANSSGDYKAIAGQQFQKTLQGLKDEVDNAWAKVPKDAAPTSDSMASIHGVLNNVYDLLEGVTSIPNGKLIRDRIDQLRQNYNPTLGDIKNIMSNIGNTANAAIGMPGASDFGQELYKYRSQLKDALQTNLSGDDLKNYNTANQLSSNYYDTMAISPKIQAALYGEVDARNLSKSMMSEAEALDKSKALGLTTDIGQKALVASKLMKVIENAGYDTPNGVNINSVVKGIANSEALPQIADTPTMDALKGLNEILTGIHSSNNAQLPNVVKLLGAGLVGTGYYHGTITAPMAAAGAVGYGGLAWIANNSPLKSALGMIGRNAAEGSTRQQLSNSMYNYLANKTAGLMTRMGFYTDSDGTLNKKDTNQ
jgi:hypothetical protein